VDGVRRTKREVGVQKATRVGGSDGGQATDGGGESQFGIGIDDKTGQADCLTSKKKSAALLKLKSLDRVCADGWRQPQSPSKQLPVPTG